MLARDKLGLLRKRMEECVDGEYQAFKSRDGAYVRKEFFGKYPELLEMVSGMTDDEVWQLRRGGHDPIKVYAAYAAAVAHRGSAHGDPRQDHQGLRDGRGRRGHEHHPSAEEDGRRGAQGLSRSLQDSRDGRPDRRGAALPAGRGQRRDAVSARAPRGAGRQPSAAPAHVGGARSAAARGLRRAAQEHRRSRDLDHDGFRADPLRRWCATRTSATASCRSSPTNRAPSAWKGCSASSEFSRRSASSTSPRMPAS